MSRTQHVGRHRVPDAPARYSVSELAFFVAIFAVPIFGAFVVPLILGGFLP